MWFCFSVTISSRYLIKIALYHSNYEYKSSIFNMDILYMHEVLKIARIIFKIT
jgi:hypothetical protein